MHSSEKASKRAEKPAEKDDGYTLTIVWTDVLQPCTSAAADKGIAVFGALSFWWMGEHGRGTGRARAWQTLL